MYVAALESEAGDIEGGIPPNGIQKVDKDNMETKEPDRLETETRNVSLDPAKHVAERTDLMTSMFMENWARAPKISRARLTEKSKPS